MIWEIRYKFFHAAIVCDDSFSWFCLILSSSVFWLSNLEQTNDVCSFSTCRATYVSLMKRLRRSHHQIESDSSSENDSETTRIVASHQTASDSLNLTKATYSLIRKTRESCWDEISSNLWEIEKSHQTWRICLCFSCKQSREAISDAEELNWLSVVFCIKKLRECFFWWAFWMKAETLT